MPSTRRKLTPAQSAAVAQIAEIRIRRAGEKERLIEQHRRQMEQELEAIDMAYAQAIRRAHVLGVPKVRIGQEGMNTRNPYAANEWLAKTEETEQILQAAGRPAFTWLPDGESVAIHIPSFPTSSTADDYPEILEGVVKRSPAAPLGWAVVSDPLTTQTDFGTLPGHLTWELDQDSRDSLVAQLNEWAGIS